MTFALFQAAAYLAQAQPPSTVVGAFQALLDTNFGVSSETLFKVLMSVVTLVAMSVIRRLLTRLLEGRFQDPRARFQFTKGLALASSIITLIAIGTIWLGVLKHMGAFLGLMIAGVAFALKDLIADVAGWAFIMWKRPFDVGDRIEIAGFAGDVVDIRIFEFTLLEIGNWVDADQSTGRVVHIPNQKLLSDPIANYTAEFPYVGTRFQYWQPSRAIGRRRRRSWPRLRKRRRGSSAAGPRTSSHGPPVGCSSPIAH